MKQEQTIDDILEMLKASVSEETSSEHLTKDSDHPTASLSDEMLKAALQQRYGDSAEQDEVRFEDPYTLDSDFLQEAAEVSDETEDTFEELDLPEEADEADENDEIEEDATLECVESSSETECLEDEEDLAPWEDAPLTEETEESEEAEMSIEEDAPLLEESTGEMVLALDYVSEDEEELTYEILPKLGEEEIGALILRNYSTDPVPVHSEVEVLEPEEFLSEEHLLSGVTYQTPALNPVSDAEKDSAYDLLCQFGCEDEWEEENIPETKPAEEPSVTEYESYEQTEKVLASYRRKKILELVRLCGVIFGAILLFFYETLPMLEVPFVGIFDYQEYIGSYLLIGFQILLICTVAFGKRMAHGALRLFSLRPNFYSFAALSVIFTGIYDMVVFFTVREWVAPFHFVSSLLLVLLAVGEYLMLSREIKAFSVVSSDPARKKYTLLHHDEEDPCVQKMKRGGLYEDAKVAVPEVCEFPHGFFASIRNEEVFGMSTVAAFLIPSLLMSVLATVVAILLHREISITLLTAMSVLMAILPLGAIFAVCFPLWLSSARLSKRQITFMGQKMIDRIASTDVMMFDDVHLFRPCTTTDTGIAFYEKSQAATILGCLECLYATIGGPLAGAFSNIPKEYRFEEIRIRRLMKGGVEAFVDRKYMLLVGDAAFMKRYGLDVPSSKETAGRTAVYISLNGKISAKMSVRYQTEPIFEMLAERMDQNNVQCVIKTFDPMISAAMISAQRSFGCAPISVLHQTVAELNGTLKADKNADGKEVRTTAVLSVASRFKLVEALIWSKAIQRILKMNRRILAIFSVIGVLAVALLIGFDQIFAMNQYCFILWGGLEVAVLAITTLLSVPKKKYFSVEACRAAWEKKQNKQRREK